MMSEAIVARWMKSATTDMIRNKMTEISCPCRKCRLTTLMNPYSGLLQSHLLARGFMDGYTQWISEDVEEGQWENNGVGGREGEESSGHDEGDDGNDHEDEQADHEGHD